MPFAHHPASSGKMVRTTTARLHAGFRALRPRSIRGMLLILMVVALVPVLLVQGALHYSRLQERRTQELQANLEVARAVAATFDAYTDHILSQELTIGVAFTDKQPLAPEQANRLLLDSALGYPSVRYYSWLNPDGRVLYSALSEAVGTDLSDRPYFQQIAQGGEWVVSNLLIGKVTGQPTFAVARGIRSPSGTLLGIVVATADPTQLGDVLGVQRAGHSAIAIIDGEGRGVYRYPDIAMTWDRRDWIAGHPSMQRALAGQEVTDVYTSSTDGLVWMAGLAPIRSIGWVASASRPVEEAMAPVVQDFLHDFELLLLVAFAAALAALAIGRRITVPVRQLRDHALAIGRGELSQPLEVSGPDELEDLAAAFNRMAKEIAVRQQGQERLLEQLRDANNKLTTSLQEQVELLERREDLLRTLSHDLRTPLTAIHGHAQMLQRIVDRAAVGDRATQSAIAVITGARQMNAMIQDLVDSARLDSGQVTLAKEAVDLQSFAPEMKDRLAGAIDVARVRIAVPEGLPPVWADPARLERILTNLLSNALKYSPPETEVELAAERTGADVTVSVIDHGIGIAGEDLPHLFERYYRATGARKSEGLGLGLFVTKMLVEALGGRLWVESTLGDGAGFHFTLPVAPAEGE
jgi:signal transduction histidine kinase